MNVAVYSIAWSEDGPTKVGIAQDVVFRLVALQNGNPYRLRIFFAALVEIDAWARKVEKHVIKGLSAKRLVGEWFSVGPKELAERIRQECKRLNIEWSPWSPTDIQRERREVQLAPKVVKVRESRPPRPARLSRKARIEQAYAEARRLHQEIGGRPNGL